MSRHEEAYISFRHHIGKFKLKGFERAWREYCEPNIKEVPSKPFIEYDSVGDYQKEKEMRKLVLDRINHLLKYAQPK